ncbi:MAG TPA: PaaX family transcriptional regulator C-terminal domain-containing protein [Euzebya sp.]|nr:PaaX family transcriptional regulator C-terminal domain-containing protein [Euzebya sp.]
MSSAPRSRILDVYAMFVRPVGGWLAISDLISLLQPLGVDAQAVRSATSRMKRSELLIPDTMAGQAGYALSAEALGILQDGDKRIFRSVDDEAETWIVALFSVPEAERSKRYQIRSRLERLGFGQGPASSWFAPSVVLPETQRMLQHSGLAGYVTLWDASHVGFGRLVDVVAAAWDLGAIMDAHGSYIDVADGITRRWSQSDAGDAVAWVDYLDNLAAWRPLPYLDPGLPSGVVPPGWPAGAARARFTALEAALKPGAVRFFTASVGSSPSSTA